MLQLRLLMVTDSDSASFSHADSWTCVSVKLAWGERPRAPLLTSGEIPTAPAPPIPLTSHSCAIEVHRVLLQVQRWCNIHCLHNLYPPR